MVGPYLLATFSAIFFVVDPIAVVPIFLAMTPQDDDVKRSNMALRAAIVSGGVLLMFALAGKLVFGLFGVTLPAFKVAGGLLLLLTSLDQLRSHAASTRTSGAEVSEGQAKDDIAIVPLGVPLLAGPGSIATVMVLAADATEAWQTGAILASIVLTSVLSWASLRAATRIDYVLGATGKAVFLRMAGLLLAAVAVQFMIAGLGEAFPGLVRR